MHGFYGQDISSPLPLGEYAYAGFFIGTETSETGSVRTYTVREFDFDGRTERSEELSLTFGTSTSAVVAPFDYAFGRLRRTGEPTEIFSARREPLAEKARTDSTGLAAAYSGYIRSVASSARATATMDAAGTFVAETPEGCTINGKMAPRAVGNLFDVDATMNNRCPSPAGPFTGHALRAPSTKQLLLMLTSGDKENGTFLSLLPSD